MKIILVVWGTYNSPVASKQSLLQNTFKIKKAYVTWYLLFQSAFFKRSRPLWYLNCVHSYSESVNVHHSRYYHKCGLIQQKSRMHPLSWGRITTVCLLCNCKIRLFLCFRYAEMPQCFNKHSSLAHFVVLLHEQETSSRPVSLSLWVRVHSVTWY